VLRSAATATGVGEATSAASAGSANVNSFGLCFASSLEARRVVSGTSATGEVRNSGDRLPSRTRVDRSGEPLAETALELGKLLCCCWTTAIIAKLPSATEMGLETCVEEETESFPRRTIAAVEPNADTGVESPLTAPLEGTNALPLSLAGVVAAERNKRMRCCSCSDSVSAYLSWSSSASSSSTVTPIFPPCLASLLLLLLLLLVLTIVCPTGLVALAGCVGGAGGASTRKLAPSNAAEKPRLAISSAPATPRREMAHCICDMCAGRAAEFNLASAAELCELDLRRESAANELANASLFALLLPALPEGRNKPTSADCTLGISAGGLGCRAAASRAAGGEDSGGYDSTVVSLPRAFPLLCAMVVARSVGCTPAEPPGNGLAFPRMEAARVSRERTVEDFDFPPDDFAAASAAATAAAEDVKALLRPAASDTGRGWDVIRIIDAPVRSNDGCCCLGAWCCCSSCCSCCDWLDGGRFSCSNDAVADTGTVAALSLSSFSLIVFVVEAFFMLLRILEADGEGEGEGDAEIDSGWTNETRLLEADERSTGACSGCCKDPVVFPSAKEERSWGFFFNSCNTRSRTSWS
jgi:hypothetical protein